MNSQQQCEKCGWLKEQCECSEGYVTKIIIRIKKWFCGKMSMPELKIENPNTILLQRAIDINDWTASDAERILVNGMVSELIKHTVFIDYKTPTGYEQKGALLKVVKPKHKVKSI